MNRRYIESVHKFQRWMYEGGASGTNIEATMAELYEFACPSFMVDVIRADQVAMFVKNDKYLREL